MKVPLNVNWKYGFSWNVTRELVVWRRESSRERIKLRSVGRYSGQQPDTIRRRLMPVVSTV